MKFAQTEPMAPFHKAHKKEVYYYEFGTHTRSLIAFHEEWRSLSLKIFVNKNIQNFLSHYEWRFIDVIVLVAILVLPRCFFSWYLTYLYWVLRLQTSI